MKSRLYQRNVIDGEKKMAEFTADYGKDHRKHIAKFIFMIILTCLLGALLIWLLARWIHFMIPSVVVVPVTVRLLLPHFYRLRMERQALRLLRTNKDHYAEWMSLQETKISGDDWRSACQVFCQYRDTFREKHEELRIHLNEQLKQKPANQLLVCVFAGLIFLCNDSADYKLLFDAKYKHGAAGNMIPEAWIRVLDPTKAEEFPKSHLECAEEFCTYWEQKSSVVKA